MDKVFRRVRNFAGEFFIGCWNFFEPFSKLKTTFCKASIKTKINMTCVSEEYENRNGKLKNGYS